MSMSMNILAILISFAMMLTGAGGEGQPAEAARTLSLSNIYISVNDQSVTLNPSLRLGASTDGEKAVYSLGVDLNGETLFPVQLGVSEGGLTALFEKSDVAANVSAEALNALSEQASQLLASAAPADEESAKLMSFITEEYIPAYAGLLEAAGDPAFIEEVQQKGNAIFDETIDRGEGKAVTEEIDGKSYDLNEYSYTITGDQLAALVDGVYASNEKLSAFSQAIFKLYDMLPEESGLNGMNSFADVFGKTGLDMTMDVVEKLSDDREIDIMDSTITMDMSAFVQAAVQAETAKEANEDEDVIGGADEPTDIAVEIPEIAPIVMNIHSSQVGDAKDAVVTCDYEINDGEDTVGMSINVDAHSVGLDEALMSMLMTLTQDGQELGSLNFSLSADTDEATGDSTHSIAYGITASGVNVTLMDSGVAHGDGTASDDVLISAQANGMDVNVSFNLAVTTDAIEDKANGHEAALVIDNFDDETMSSLFEGEAFQAAAMQVVGSLSADAQKLTADESVQQLMGLFTAVYDVTASGAEYDYSDGSFEGEEPDDDYEYQEPEDDGKLNYEVPQFTYLPEGWEVKENDVDTAYDWVSMTIEDATGDNTLYVSISESYGDDTKNYLVGEDGKIEAVDGREVTITDYGDDNVYVSWQEAGVYVNLSFYGKGADMETIGKIVAGLKF